MIERKGIIMKNFEDFVNGLNQDITISDSVNQRIEETLQGLETRRKHNFRFLKAATAAACVLVAVGAVLVSNSAFASSLPIIGGIFEKVQNQVIYSGNYSNKKSVDTDTDGKGETIYSAQDQDIKLTVSEVYSDGFSIFATMKMESQKYDFSTVEVETDGRQAINLATSYGVNEDVGPYDYELLLDGKNEGKNAFIGMVKFDKAEVSSESGKVNILVRNISIFREGEGDPEIIEGQWKLLIPYETDQENLREIPVGEETKDGLTVEKLFLSPYQLVVFSNVPEGEPSYETAVFDQNGERLSFEEIGDKKDELESEIFSLQGRELSKVHLYVTQNKDNMVKMHQAESEAEAEKLSEKDFVVEITP